MLLTAIKSVDTAFTAVQECLLPNFLLDRGKCMLTVKSLVSASLGCLCTRLRRNIFLQLAYKMAFCYQIKEQKTLSCLPLASEMYRHSMALNSTCRGRNKISYLKKFKFVFQRGSPWSLVKWPLSGLPTSDKELVDSWLDSRSQVLYFGMVPSPSHFGNY